jgi:hypothetical protein
MRGKECVVEKSCSSSEKGTGRDWVPITPFKVFKGMPTVETDLEINLSL